MVIMHISNYIFWNFHKPFGQIPLQYHKHCTTAPWKCYIKNVISTASEEYRCISWFKCIFSHWNNNFFTFYSSYSIPSPLNKWFSLHVSCQRCPQRSVRRAGSTCWGANEYLKRYLPGLTVGYLQSWRLSSPRPPAVQNHSPSDTNTWSHVFKWHKRI